MAIRLAVNRDAAGVTREEMRFISCERALALEQVFKPKSVS
jgi:hypothetical protein